jgi:hypothetical protein
LVRTIALVVAFGSVIVVAYVIVRRWRRPFDHVIVVLGALIASIGVEIPYGSLLVGIGGGVSLSVLTNLALRATMPYPGMGEPQPRAPLPAIALALSEPLFALAALAFWVTEIIAWAVPFTVLALASVAANIAWVLRHDTSYWPPPDGVAP